MSRFRKGTAAADIRDVLGIVAAVATGDGGPDVEYATVEKAEELRYTFGPMYPPNVLDAHGEFATPEDLRKAVWDFVRAGDRTLRKQHGPRKAGEIVEMVQWPFELETEIGVPGQPVKKVKFPANTVYTGVVWQPDTWADVKKGLVTGYSMGGAAVRVRGIPADGLSKLA